MLSSEPLLRRYADGSWLTPQLILFASIVSLALSVVAVTIGLAGTRHGIDPLGRPLGTDFTSFWSAGRLAAAGHAREAYDWDAVRAVQKAVLGSELFYPWSYPPVFLMVAQGLGYLPYLPALAVWLCVTFGLALAVYRRVLPQPLALWAALGCPAVLVCVGHGQTGFLSAALMVAGLLALPDRPVWAGMLFGLLAFKPQLGLLIPIALAAGGHWRAFASAAVTFVLLIAASLAFYGQEVWLAFFASLRLTEQVVLASGGAGFEKFLSLFGWVRLWGGGTQVAYLLQGIVSVLAAITCASVWRDAGDMRLKGAALLIGTLVATPYVLDYDTVMLGMASALLVSHGVRHGLVPWLGSALAVAWLLPAAARTTNAYVPLPLTVLLLLALLSLVRRQGEQPQPTGTFGAVA